MNLGAAVAKMLPGLRTAADSLHTDLATIQRPSGPPSTATNGKVTPSFTELHTDYAVRIRSHEPFPQTPEVAGRTALIQRAELQCSASGAYFPREGDVLTITASTYNPGLVGREFRVAVAPQNSISSQHRAYVDEVRQK